VSPPNPGDPEGSSWPRSEAGRLSASTQGIDGAEQLIAGVRERGDSFLGRSISQPGRGRSEPTQADPPSPSKEGSPSAATSEVRSFAQLIDWQLVGSYLVGLKAQIQPGGERSEPNPATATPLPAAPHNGRRLPEEDATLTIGALGVCSFTQLFGRQFQRGWSLLSELSGPSQFSGEAAAPSSPQTGQDALSGEQAKPTFSWLSGLHQISRSTPPTPQFPEDTQAHSGEQTQLPSLPTSAREAEASSPAPAGRLPTISRASIWDGSRRASLSAFDSLTIAAERFPAADPPAWGEQTPHEAPEPAATAGRILPAAGEPGDAQPSISAIRGMWAAASGGSQRGLRAVAAKIRSLGAEISPAWKVPRGESHAGFGLLIGGVRSFRTGLSWAMGGGFRQGSLRQVRSALGGISWAWEVADGVWRVVRGGNLTEHRPVMLEAHGLRFSGRVAQAALPPLTEVFRSIPLLFRTPPPAASNSSALPEEETAPSAGAPILPAASTHTEASVVDTALVENARHSDNSASHLR
jgi:hypothetical protein